MHETQIIDNFAALPVGVWLDILAVNADTSRDDVDKQVGTLALLTGLTEREVLTLPIVEYRDLARKADFLGVAPTRLPRAARSYKAGRFTLRPHVDLRKITAAQYIDFQTFAPEGDKRLVELLSVALIPDGCEYNDGYDIAEVQDAIRADISVEQALSLTAFFLSRFAALIRSTRNSLRRLARTERNRERRGRLVTSLTEMETAMEALLQGGAGLRT